MTENTNYTFIAEEGERIDSIPVYTFEQYIITRRNDSLVQGFLTVFLKYIDGHNFSPVDSNKRSQKNFDAIPSGAFSYHEPAYTQNIIKALAENNINILEHDIRYHTSFYFPVTLYYSSVGELEGILAYGGG